jgi:hypothetical protein
MRSKFGSWDTDLPDLCRMTEPGGGFVRTQDAGHIRLAASHWPGRA